MLTSSLLWLYKIKRPVRLSVSSSAAQNIHPFPDWIATSPTIGELLELGYIYIYLFIIIIILIFLSETYFIGLYPFTFQINLAWTEQFLIAYDVKGWVLIWDIQNQQYKFLISLPTPSRALPMKPNDQSCECSHPAYGYCYLESYCINNFAVLQLCVYFSRTFIYHSLLSE